MNICVLLNNHIGALGEMSNTTEAITAITTTQPSGTITLPIWVIYAIVIPILGIAAIVALIAFIRWTCK